MRGGDRKEKRQKNQSINRWWFILLEGGTMACEKYGRALSCVWGDLIMSLGMSPCLRAVTCLNMLNLWGKETGMTGLRPMIVTATRPLQHCPSTLSNWPMHATFYHLSCLTEIPLFMAWQQPDWNQTHITPSLPTHLSWSIHCTVVSRLKLGEFGSWGGGFCIYSLIFFWHFSDHIKSSFLMWLGLVPEKYLKVQWEKDIPKKWWRFLGTFQGGRRLTLHKKSKHFSNFGFAYC